MRSRRPRGLFSRRTGHRLPPRVRNPGERGLDIEISQSLARGLERLPIPPQHRSQTQHLRIGLLPGPGRREAPVAGRDLAELRLRRFDPLLQLRYLGAALSEGLAPALQVALAPPNGRKFDARREPQQPVEAHSWGGWSERRRGFRARFFLASDGTPTHQK